MRALLKTLWLWLPLVALLVLFSCSEQTAPYKRSYIELDRGNYREVSLMASLPWCDEACQLRARAAKGLLMLDSNADPQATYQDLREVVRSPLFKNYIPPSQQQKLIDAYCLVSYRNFKASLGRGNPADTKLVETVESDCAKASVSVRDQVNQAMARDYGQVIPGLIEHGQLEQARKATSTYVMLPNADRAKSAEWEEKIAVASQAATSSHNQVWLLVRRGEDHSAPLVGEPTPIVMGVFKERANCEQEKSLRESREGAGDSALAPDASQLATKATCLSSSDNVWGGQKPETMWLLLMGERWDTQSMRISCKPRTELARTPSWGIYRSAGSCERARRELFGDIPCAICLPATDVDVVR